jgi:hypothetical protein
VRGWVESALTQRPVLDVAPDLASRREVEDVRFHRGQARGHAEAAFEVHRKHGLTYWENQSRRLLA